MRFGSVCSGIEAASVAWGPLGWKASWVAEIDPFPSAVLAYHYPDVPNHGDMTLLPLKVSLGEVEAPDILVGGTPCQSFSIAGMRGGLSDFRGQLTMTFVSLANEIDIARKEDGKKECIVVWENVPGVLSSRDNAFGCFLAALAGEDEPYPIPEGKTWAKCGVVFGPQRAVAWRVLDAQYFGVAQRRRRVFVVASARNDFHPAQVLLEFNGVRRDTAPRRKAGQGTSSDAQSGAPFSRGKGRRTLNHPPALPNISMCLNAGGMGRLDAETETLLPFTHSLRGEGFDASEDGTGRGTPLVPVVSTSGHDLIGTIDAQIDRKWGCNQWVNAGQGAIQQQPVVIKGAAIGRKPENGSQFGEILEDGSVYTLNCVDQHAVAFHHNAQAAQLPTADRDTSISDSLTCSQQAAVAVDCYNGSLSGEVFATLGANTGQSANHSDPSVMRSMQVRRLTPRECERLQGFHDDYTLIPWRTWQEAARKGKSFERMLQQRGMTLRGPSLEDCPDGPRYKALGNSMAVPVMNFIGRRINYGLANAWKVEQDDEL